MVLHPQARTTPLVRAEIVQRVLDGEAVASVARAFRISRQTVYKWVGRVRASAGVQDRSSRPRRSPHATGAAVVAAIVELRRSRKLFAWQIALGLDVPRSTVVRILRRVGLHRLALLEPPPVFQRYEFERPGQLVHIDIKKLSKFETQGHRVDGVRHNANAGLGFEHVYVCIDDASRLAFLEVREREDRFEAAAFLRSAVRWFHARGIRIERVMTDNGKVFLSRDFQDGLKLIGARHHRTPMYTPRVNGKAERFIRTMLNECAYGIAFTSSRERRAVLIAWNRFYNEERPHSAINYRAPASRLNPLSTTS